MSSTNSGPPRPTIYVCDPSAEGTRIESALSQAGYDAVDVPRHRLLDRVRLERPAAVILDVVDASSLTVVAQIRTIVGGESVHVLFVAAVGGLLRSSEDALMQDGSGLFLRPIDAAALVRKIESLVGPGDAQRERPGPRVRSPSQTPPEDLPSGRVVGQAANEGRFVPEVGLPELGDDIRQLLAAAEARVASLDLSGLSPNIDGEAEIGVLLGPEDLEGVLPDEAEPEAMEPNLGSERSYTTSAGHRRGKSDEERLQTPGPLQGAKQRRAPQATGTAAPGRGSTMPGYRSALKPTSINPSAAERRTPIPRNPALAAAYVPHLANDEPLEPPPPAPIVLARTGDNLGRGWAAAARAFAPRDLGRDLPPATLSRGTAPSYMASLVSQRATGTLSFTGDDSTRTVSLRDGDFCSAQSNAPDDALPLLLERRGFLTRALLTGFTLSPVPRLACAALVARGHLAQDDLWPLLRLHGEQIVSAMLASERGTVSFAENTGEKEGPSVFGALAGSAVFVRAFSMTRGVSGLEERASTQAFQLVPGEAYEESVDALSGLDGVIDLADVTHSIIDERAAKALSGHMLTLDALVHLRILQAIDHIGDEGKHSPPAEGGRMSSVDADALRHRIAARRRLVDEGDYFALLGVSPKANSFEIRQAYLDIRRSFDPGRILQYAQLHALEADLRAILEVVEEAYHVLRDDARRDRYRRAIGHD